MQINFGNVIAVNKYSQNANLVENPEVREQAKKGEPEIG